MRHQLVEEGGELCFDLSQPGVWVGQGFEFLKGGLGEVSRTHGDKAKKVLE